jgi:hypothetical protein
VVDALEDGRIRSPCLWGSPFKVVAKVTKSDRRNPMILLWPPVEDGAFTKQGRQNAVFRRLILKGFFYTLKGLAYGDEPNQVCRSYGIVDRFIAIFR